MKITRAKGGTEERTVDLADVAVPDCWHAAMRIGEAAGKAFSAGDERKAEVLTVDQETVLETWHLAHDLLKALRDFEKVSELCMQAFEAFERMQLAKEIAMRHGLPDLAPREDSAGGDGS